MRILVNLMFIISVSGCSPSGVSAILLHNAVIYTVDPAQPVAAAMAYSADGTILAVGAESDLREQFEITGIIDAGGRAVVPGLIDAHAHLTGFGVAMLQARLEGAKSVEETLQRLRDFESVLPADSWLTGRGWDQNDWPVKEFPDRAMLDEYFPDRPVWLRRIDGHAGWANSAALGAAGLGEASDWQPEGGLISRDADGVPTGIMVDNAMAHIDAVVPPLSESDYERALELALTETARHGLTGVHETGIGVSEIDRYKRFIDEGRFPLRLYAMSNALDALFRRLCDSGPVIDYGGRLTARAVKLYADGALGSRGAALHQPYDDDPENTGLLVTDPDALKRATASVLDCGLQIGIHAIGDFGNTAVVDAIAFGMAAVQDNPGRHRNEHVQVIGKQDIARMAELGIIASMQPTHATSDMYWAEDRLGPERVLQAYAWQQILDAGVVLALGSDFPVESVNPLLGFYAAVTRMDTGQWPEGGWYPDQKLSREQALRGFTLDAAYAAFQEEQLGSLEAGKRADFVILSADIMQIDVREIPSASVVATYIDGQAVYQR
jgi:predicted amidohydrolase YtcJ